MHYGTASAFIKEGGALRTVVLKDESLEATMPALLWLFYIWLVFSVLRKNMPKIFRCLGFGIVISLLGIMTMLVIDVVGHSTLEMPVNVTEPPCMFQIIKDKYKLKYQALNIHWSVLIPPNILLGIGPLIVTTSTLGFISAQSPHSMKGLLVGIFFAIQGFFQLVGYILTLPLSFHQYWTQMPIDNSQLQIYSLVHYQYCWAGWSDSIHNNS